MGEIPASAKAADSSGVPNCIFYLRRKPGVGFGPWGHVNSPGLLLFVKGSVAPGAQEPPLKTVASKSQLEQRMQKGHWVPRTGKGDLGGVSMVPHAVSIIGRISLHFNFL